MSVHIAKVSNDEGNNIGKQSDQETKENSKSVEP